ncbi:MAG: hypothetical protein V4636_12485, partial [Pseudomonadota bacterium]
YNASAAPEAMARLGRALGGGNAPWTDVHGMLGRLGLPASLRDIGMLKKGCNMRWIWSSATATGTQGRWSKRHSATCFAAPSMARRPHWIETPCATSTKRTSPTR